MADMSKARMGNVRVDSEGQLWRTLEVPVASEDDDPRKLASYDAVVVTEHPGPVDPYVDAHIADHAVVDAKIAPKRKRGGR